MQVLANKSIRMSAILAFSVVLACLLLSTSGLALKAAKATEIPTQTNTVVEGSIEEEEPGETLAATTSEEISGAVTEDDETDTGFDWWWLAAALAAPAVIYALFKYSKRAS